MKAANSIQWAWVREVQDAEGNPAPPFWILDGHLGKLVRALYKSPYILHTWTTRDGVTLGQHRQISNIPPQGYKHVRTIFIMGRTVRMYHKESNQ